jgi:hypothetical protein
MQEGSFQEIRRQKGHATDETTGTSNKAAVQTKTSAALKDPPPRRLSPEIYSPPPEQQKWTLTPPVLRPCHMRRQFLAKQLGRPQL